MGLRAGQPERMKQVRQRSVKSRALAERARVGILSFLRRSWLDGEHAGKVPGAMCFVR
jgi:hypothetical protein